MRIRIPGKPIAKKRPRFVRRGKFVGTYNEQETEEGKWILLARDQITEKISKPSAVHLECEFRMPIPKSTSKKKTLEMHIGDIPHIKKPDLDNLIKFVKDCLNNLAWDDDSQVISIEAFKCYSNEPETIIEIMEDK